MPGHTHSRICTTAVPHAVAVLGVWGVGRLLVVVTPEVVTHLVRVGK